MVHDPFGGPPAFFNFFMVVIPILVIGGFIFIIVKGLSTWATNNASPVLVERVIVVSKRTKVYGGGETNARTAYFVTFEFIESKNRLELQVSGQESGLLIEGDIGDLTYQGTRYKGFNRIQ
ncbi:DUF2500 domain-containing protein [Bacillus salitolerans]|uniref:DUF2500 domain-containing protein n=1 Tax=Bacillus salitolerans TaxID=1437434 RepID=A0ABW4LKE9_9BACI